MVEDGTDQLAKSQPRGVCKELAPVVRELHRLWHLHLLDDDTKRSGWGRELDAKSDMLSGEAADILAKVGKVGEGIFEDMYKFAIAYGRLSISLPYIGYHTVDSIVMATGAIPSVSTAPST